MNGRTKCLFLVVWVVGDVEAVLDCDGDERNFDPSQALSVLYTHSVNRRHREALTPVDKPTD